MKRYGVCIIYLMALLSLTRGSALAQEAERRPGPRPKPEMTAWWDQPIVRDLGLSEDQNRQIRAIVAESRDRLIQMRTAVDSAEAVLQDAMNEERVNTQKTEAAIERVVVTRADMMRAVSLMSLRLRSLLTSAQWQQLQKRESQPPPPLPGQPQNRKALPEERPNRP